MRGASYVDAEHGEPLMCAGWDARTLCCCARATSASVSTVMRSRGSPLPDLTDSSAATRSRMGESVLHGPHQLSCVRESKGQVRARCHRRARASCEWTGKVKKAKTMRRAYSA